MRTLLILALIAIPASAAPPSTCGAVDEYYRALCSYQKRQFPAAEKGFRAIVDAGAQDPATIKALYFLGRTYMKTGRFAEITPEQKPLYHAAAVFGANYVAALLDIAQGIMYGAGIGDARSELAALAHSAIDNWAAHEDDTRFTGPAARGDLETIRRHLNALRDQPRLAELYEILAEHIARQNVAGLK